MAQDIRAFGSSEGVGFYWVKVAAQWGAGHCELVAIDELGSVTPTTGRRDYDEAARTREEAVLHHLAPAISQADSDLERRRKEREDEPEAPEPVVLSPADARFYYDGD